MRESWSVLCFSFWSNRYLMIAHSDNVATNELIERVTDIAWGPIVGLVSAPVGTGRSAPRSINLLFHSQEVVEGIRATTVPPFGM